MKVELDDLITMDELSRLLGTSYSSVMRRVRMGEIKTLRPGNHERFVLKADIDKIHELFEK